MNLRGRPKPKPSLYAHGGTATRANGRLRQPHFQHDIPPRVAKLMIDYAREIVRMSPARYELHMRSIESIIMHSQDKRQHGISAKTTD